MTRYTKTMAETLLEIKKKQEAIDATDTGGEEEVSMAVRQVSAMQHFLQGIESRVKETGDMEEWFQNKLTKAHDYLKTLYAYGKGDMAEGTVHIHREYEPGQYYDGDLKKLLMDIKKAGGKVKDIQKPSRREPNLAIEVDGDLKKIKKQIEKDDDGLTAVEEEAKQPVQWPSQPLEEKLKVSDGLGAWISDFQKSDAPQFDNKTPEEKKKMAIAAYVSAGGKLD